MGKLKPHLVTNRSVCGVGGGGLTTACTHYSLLFCLLQKPLGEQFRKEVHIKNLPSIFKKAKPMLETEVLDSEGGGLATIFEP